MLVGWHTRAATITLWVIIGSLQARNNHVTYGADTLMRVVLFWSMFLPLGAMWSFDAEQNAKTPTASVSNLATFGLLAQVACIYFFTALQKSGFTWRESYDAVYYALGARDLSTWMGEWTFQTAPQGLFAAFTMGTLWLEFTIPILLLAPVRAGWLRMVGVVFVIALHMSIGINMSVGVFPALSIATVLVAIPASFWMCVAKSSPSNRYARLKKWIEVERPVPPAALAAPPEPELLGFLPFKAAGAANIPQFTINLMCAAAIVASLMWNLTTISAFTLPEPVRRTAVATGLYQDWAMFAPNPREASVWFIVDGQISAGANVDLLTPMFEDDFSVRLAPEWDQSSDVQLQNERWRKYLLAIQFREDDSAKMAGYLCRSWNEENAANDRLETVTFTVGSSKTLPNSERAEPVYRQLGTWYCT